VFKANGRCVVIMAFLHHWKDLCKAMDRPDLMTDPNFATDPDRLAHRPELIKMIEDWLATFPDRDSAIAHMQKNAVPSAPVLSIEETVKHPHLRERGTVRTIDDPIAGSFDIPGMPLKFSQFPQPLPLEAATLGQHNREVLRDLLGRDDDEIRELRKAGVLVEGKY
jgi:crotonobetainyl-CoA:carnitine CoA-transferase CaiB-like acyl-CoA transferase